jgi:hypothetical protein
MARVITVGCTAVMALVIGGSFQLVSPRDGLIALGGSAYAADMRVKAPPPPPPAPVGKGKTPIFGKGKAPVVTARA